MRRKAFWIIILSSLLFQFSQPVFSFDFAPEVGEAAPEFHLSGINNTLKNKKEWDLMDFKGQWLVLYFYPKDFTAGCTIEAKGFSQLKKQFKLSNAQIVGISADDEESHDSFCSEKSINYTLLSDPKGVISERYGSWIPPYSDRNTFLISPEGIVSYRWISVTPINHAKEVLNKLNKLA
tara:strand:- start:2655 stop:3191 length:537 start_codon:yes stop_codon:yes gene_type:complete